MYSSSSMILYHLFAEPEFLEEFSFPSKMMYLVIATTVCRFKYYHAWLLSDAICNASGLGFNGYDAKGRARWDLISNVDVLKFEVSTVYGNSDFLTIVLFCEKFLVSQLEESVCE
jgi:Predicted membrane protein